ncbi:peptide ABC transporter ATP-binding protein [Campylobacter sp. MIT 12-8780]|uniref:ATP-binding cassette domain-containing protein n=1 Tax=unclassified Campylobacter TaxID=2593542 RepID=UPI00115D600D|nr:MULTISPECIES: ATP-binding cassette domain-containing protein [unclassified Campylobacter]NDJ27756.1 ATP-binding cassette domain-containing protein [Campylobacter sp. MIT 19-121]TQR41038.1 peptide ABC transporter ATP-binding protein [Campylobacter sp. MIT 12-8780]
MLLRVENLTKQYAFKKHFYSNLEFIKIFKELNFSLKIGENLLIEGESGSGKSTLARILCMIEKPSSGKIFFEDKNIFSLNFEQQRQLRRHIQYVFQEQKLALNPYKKAKQLIDEIYENFNLKVNLKAFDGLLELFEFDKSFLNLKAQQLSGGMASRLGLIRALLPSPKLLILDEISACLDLSASINILSYLKKLQDQRQISYVFISHQKELFLNFKPKIITLN